MNDVVSTASAFLYEKTTLSLLELSKANIERVDYWFSWMLGVAGVLATFIGIAFLVIAGLTWHHFNQAKKAGKLLDEVEQKRKQFDETARFIQSVAERAKQHEEPEKKSKKSTASQTVSATAAIRKEIGLSKSDVAERSKQHRGFSPVLFQAVGDNAVYAVDEYGYKHWIPDPPTLSRMGYSWTDVKQISKEEIDKIPTGHSIPLLR